MKNLKLIMILLLIIGVLNSVVASEKDNDGSELRSFTLSDCDDVSCVTIPAHTLINTEPKDYSGAAFLKRFEKYNKKFLKDAEMRNYSESDLLKLISLAQKFLLEGSFSSDESFANENDPVCGEINKIFNSYFKEQARVHAELYNRYHDLIKEKLEDKRLREEKQKVWAQRREQLSANETFIQALIRTVKNEIRRIVGISNENNGSDDEYAAEGSCGSNWWD